MNPRRILIRMAIFAIVFLAFARLTICQFTFWDDQATIHQNFRLNPPSFKTLAYYWNLNQAGEQTTMGLYVPVTYTVWSALAMFAQLDRPDAQGITLNAAYFHTANVAIHALTAVLVFQLLLRLFNSDVAAAIGALLFALHPVQVESVGWISGTKDLLCGFFSVSALLMYVRSVQVRSDLPRAHWPSRWRYLLGLLFFVLAMLSKPTAVVVPLMAVSVAVLLLDRPPKQVLISLLPWFVAMIPCLIWTKIVQPATWQSPLPLWARPAVALDAIAFYLYKLVWPIHLCVDYGHNPQAIVDNHQIYFSWILPALVLVVLWRQRSRCVTAAALLFLLPVVPVLGFSSFEFQKISTTSDHYLYLSMLGAAVLMTWAMVQIKSRWKFPAAIVILVLFCIRSILQEATWYDTRTVFYHALDLNPKSVVSSDGLGYLTGREARRLRAPADHDKARALYDQSIAWYQRSVKYAPDSVPSIYNLALDYEAIGRPDIGRQLMHHIVELQATLPPRMRVDSIDLGRLLYDFPDTQGAIDWLDQVLRTDPGNRQALMLRQEAIERLRTGGNPPPAHN